MNVPNEQKSITYLPLNSIRVSPDNPNSHSETKITILANNIARFGLLNPISVVEQEPGVYEIVAGEGRYLAYVELDQQDPTSGKWNSIPAIILAVSDEFSTWGRRLGENRVRSFNWVAECVSLAGMKADGVSKAELSQLFGLAEKRIERMIQVGRIPNLQDLGPNLRAPGGPKVIDLGVTIEPLITLKEAINFLLPLRLQTGRESRPGNVPLWDYSEVQACIAALVSGQLKPEDLPLYSADRREVIGKAKAKAEGADQQDPQESRHDAEQLAKLSTKINNMAAFTETIKKSNETLQRDREALKAEVTKLSKTVKELQSARAEGSSNEIQRLVEEKLQQERQKIRDEARAEAQKEIRQNWTELGDEKKVFETYEQSIHTKEAELKEWEKLIDHGRRSMDREPRARMLDAVDGLLAAVASLRKNWERLSGPDFEAWIEHMKAAQDTYHELYEKCIGTEDDRDG